MGIPLIKISLYMLVIISDQYWTEARKLSRCEAVAELNKAKISRTFMSNWVCLMEKESGLNTTLVSGPKTRSSYKFGVFQISSLTWCSRGRRGGQCSTKCEDLADDNIQDDIACAVKIFETQGFKDWEGWLKNCKGKPLPDIARCKTR